MLDIPTLQAWRGACRTAEFAAVKWLEGRYHALLRRYVLDPNGFRSLLRVTGSVLSGSSVLNLLDRERSHMWTPTDLDIYTATDSTYRVAWYLIHVEGYMFKRSVESSYNGAFAGFRQVVHLTKGEAHIDIIQSVTISALHPIGYFWGTHVMNYISADFFCIAYPKTTLEGRGLLNPVALVDRQYPGKRTLAVLKKYAERGYEFRVRPYAWDASVDTECDQSEGCPRTIRRFGDRYCLMGSFHMADSPSLLPHGLPVAGHVVRWWRGGPACGGVCVAPEDAVILDMRDFPTVRTLQPPRTMRRYVIVVRLEILAADIRIFLTQEVIMMSKGLAVEVM